MRLCGFLSAGPAPICADLNSECDCDRSSSSAVKLEQVAAVSYFSIAQPVRSRHPISVLSKCNLFLATFDPWLKESLAKKLINCSNSFSSLRIIARAQAVFQAHILMQYKWVKTKCLLSDKLHGLLRTKLSCMSNIIRFHKPAHMIKPQNLNRLATLYSVFPDPQFNFREALKRLIF